MDNCGRGQEREGNPPKLVFPENGTIGDCLQNTAVVFVLGGLHHLKVGVGDKGNGQEIGQAKEKRKSADMANLSANMANSSANKAL